LTQEAVAGGLRIGTAMAGAIRKANRRDLVLFALDEQGSRSRCGAACSRKQPLLRRTGAGLP
jgi:hypothetical protein